MSSARLKELCKHGEDVLIIAHYGMLTMFQGYSIFIAPVEILKIVLPMLYAIKAAVS